MKNYAEEICKRCGSKRTISKTWNQTLEMYSGRSSVVEISQIVCTNEECQKAFEEALARDKKKYDDMKKKKAEAEVLRKENILKVKQKKAE